MTRSRISGRPSCLLTRGSTNLINMAWHGLVIMTGTVPRSMKSIRYRFPAMGPLQGRGSIVVPRAGEGQREVEDGRERWKLEVQTGGQDQVGHQHAGQLCSVVLGFNQWIAISVGPEWVLVTML